MFTLNKGSKMSVNVRICMHRCDFYLDFLKSMDFAQSSGYHTVPLCKVTDSGGSEEPILSTRPLVEDAFLTVDISFDVPFHVRLNKPTTNLITQG